MSRKNSKQATATPRKSGMTKKRSSPAPSMTCAKPMDCSGSPTRYGNMDAAMKALIDSTASLWLSGATEGKPAGVFTSTAYARRSGNNLPDDDDSADPSRDVIVGVPYSTEGMLHTEARGGTPYGASTTAGPKGELAPTAENLAICRVQGKRVAELAKKSVVKRPAMRDKDTMRETSVTNSMPAPTDIVTESSEPDYECAGD